MPEVRLAYPADVREDPGQALRTAWLRSDALVLAYMDLDRSTDLTALLPLVAPLLSGHSDLAIGTRLARTARGRARTRARLHFTWLPRTALDAAGAILHAQCGFEAIRGEVARQLLPLVQDTGPFLDTELLVLAERAGLRIAEMPVDWAGSRIGTAATAVADLRSAARALTAGRRPVAALRAQFGRAPLASHPVSYGVASQVITWWRRTIRRSPSAARRSMTSASR